MSHQYGPRGLEVAVIDASALVTGVQPDDASVLNASYDWHLDIPLLTDTQNQMAKRFGVTRIPTVILLSADGQVAQRWQGPVRPALLAQGIERLLGGPLGQLPRL